MARSISKNVNNLDKTQFWSLYTLFQKRALYESSLLRIPALGIIWYGTISEKVPSRQKEFLKQKT